MDYKPEFHFSANLKSIREWLDDVEASNLIQDKIGEYGDYINHLSCVRQQLINTPDIPEWFIKTGCQVIADKIEKKKKERASLFYKLDELHGYHKPKHKSNVDLDAIKAIPIADIMPSGPIRKAPNRLYYKAPWRNEALASLVVYINQNRWHDFGESCGGSVIDLYMKLNDCDFKQAIKELSEMDCV